MTDIDPTAIEMRTDPRVQRFQGIAAHGNTPFSVPYISQITEHLWTGGCAEGLVLPYDIVHVVSLYPWERYKARHERRSEAYIRMYDAEGGIDSAYVWDIARWCERCVLDGPTLIHCQAGLNRSALIASATLWLLGGYESGEEIIELLREKRSPAVLCNRSFEAWVRNLA